MANARITPEDQFSVRYCKTVGVMHRGAPGKGEVANFGNLPADLLGRRDFVFHWLDFHDDDEVDTTNRWTLTQLTGVAGTFDKVDDAPQGLAVLDVVGTTLNHGVQIQHDAVGRGGELYYPGTGESHIVGWEARGSMNLALNCDWFVGIAESDTTFMTAAGVLTGDNYMGFHHVAGSTVVRLVQCGTAVANGVVLANPLRSLWTPEDGDTEKRRLGLRVENHTDLFWYVDGILVGRTYVGATEGAGTVVAFDDGMCHTVCLVNGDDGADGAAATIDYMGSYCTRV